MQHTHYSCPYLPFCFVFQEEEEAARKVCIFIFHNVNNIYAYVHILQEAEAEAEKLRLEEEALRAEQQAMREEAEGIQMHMLACIVRYEANLRFL